ncbi:MAG: hypothetical protein DWQ34_28530 [Planctomycetota bacterium]|nr:MAG: hypothetical protein DWQ34_28530 [Planctomycetota bacterium]
MSQAELLTRRNELTDRLSGVDHRVRLLSLVKGAGMLAVAVGACVGFGLLADFAWDFPLAVRAGLLGLTALVAIVCAWRQLIRPAFRRASSEELAALVESRHPELHERLTSAIELSDPDEPDDYRGSLLMRELLLKQAHESVQRVPVGDAESPEHVGRWGFAGVAVILALLAPFLFVGGYGLLLTRFFAPWENLERASNLYFVVDDGDRTVARGSDVEVAAAVGWRYTESGLPDEVWLKWKNERGDRDRRQMAWSEDRERYVALLPHVFHSFQFEVVSGSARTRAYQVNVVEAPALMALMLAVDPPAYSGRHAELIDGAVGEMVVLEGSDLALSMEFNKPVADALFVWTPDPTDDIPEPHAVKSPVDIAEDGMSGALELDAGAGGVFSIVLTDRDGLHNLDEPIRRIRVIADEPPLVAFADSQAEAEARPNDVVRIPLTASDDLGVAALELHYEVLRTGGDDSNLPLTGVLETDPALLGGRAVEDVFTLDLSSLGLTEGGLISVRGKAVDERPAPGPNESWTEQRLIGISEEADPYGAQELAEQQRKVKDALSELRQDVIENREQVEELRGEAEKNLQENAAFERDADASDLAEDQRDLIDRAEQLAAIFELHPLYANLGRRTREVASEPLTNAAEQMEHSTDAELKEKTTDFQKSAEQLAAAAERLEQLEAEFEQLAALERDLLDLQQLADRTERLAGDVEEFDAARSEVRPDETDQQRQAREQQLATQQQQLQQDHQELTHDLDDLLKRRPELLDAALEDQLERLSELAERAGEIANREEALGEALREEAQRNAENLAPLSEQQQELMERAEQLAANPEFAGSLPADPVSVEELRQALEELNVGNADEAAQRQEEAAAALERFAEELAKNAELSDDPQEAARQLAERQAGLNEELRDALAETDDDRPADAPEPTSPGELAAAQAAIQAATSQLPAPRSAEPQREQAVNAAREALEALRQEDPNEAAIAAAERTQAALNQLADEIGPVEERRAEALEQLKRLQQEQERLTAETADAAARQAEDPAQTAERVAQLADQQRQVAEQLEQLDAPGAEAERQSAASRAGEAQGDLNPERLGEASESQQQANQALADLEQALRGEPTAAEAVARLQQQQRQIADAAETAAESNDAQALADQAAAQGELAEELGRLQTPAAGEERQAAQASADEAAQALQQAANDGEQSGQAMQAAAASEAALNQLAEALTPSAAENPQVAEGTDQETPPGSDNQRPASNARELAQAAAELAESQRNLAAETAAQRGQPASDERPMGDDLTTPAAAREQTELAREAAELAVQTARQSGPASTAAKQAREFAQQATMAAERAATGQLASAAESAEQAGASAEAASESLANPPQGEEGEPQPELSRQAAQLAERQRAAAENLMTAANSQDARRTAQRQGQQQLEQATRQLAEDFQEVFEQLSSAPLSAQDRAEQASQSQSASSQAQESMRAAADQQTEGDFNRAAAAAQAAAESLRQAAGQANSASERPADAQESPVPGEAGSQVAQASRELQQAGEHLNQPLEIPGPPTQTAEAGEASDDAASRGAPDEGANDPQTAQADAENMQPGEPGTENSASQSLQDAATALQQAVSRLQPASQSSQAQQASASRESQSEMPAGSPSTPQESEHAGTGTQEGISLADLELHLQELSTRDWGELPGTLQTELQSSSRRRPQGDYARLIRLYFDEISRRQSPELESGAD